MNGIIFTFLSAIFGLTIVRFTIPPLIRVVNAKKLFEPNDTRKVHTSVVPTIGGVSVYIGFALASFLASDGYSLSEVKYLYPAVLLMFFLGLKDDLLSLSPMKKIMVMIATALMLATIGDFRLHSFYGVFGIWQVDYVAGALVSALLIVGFINAFNFIDGIDGLASGVAIIISSTFGICFLLMERFDLSIVSFALAGSLIMFFRYNVFGTEYKLFMGDTGSLIIGTILAALMFKFVEHAPASGIPILSASAPAFAFGLMIVPVTDLTRIFFIRLLHKKSPFKPDRNHIHHKLLKSFPNHLTVTLIICGVNLLFIVLTLFLITTGMNINYTMALTLLAGHLTAYLPFVVARSIRKHVHIKWLKTYPD